MSATVRFTALVAACLSPLWPQNAAAGNAQEGKQVEAPMNAILRRAARGTNADREKPDKTGINLFGVGLGENFGAAFAVGVMLGALWLLMSGYV
jgi:hypothetical protein